VVADWFRRRTAEMRDARAEVPMESVPGLGDAQKGLHLLDRAVLVRQVEHALAGVASARDRQVFWLYYRVGLTAKDIARFASLGLGPKGVESAVDRMTRALREKFRGGRISEGKTKGDSFS
jgi:DNA-directed RNA polymerase specialized sigma24 family protein